MSLVDAATPLALSFGIVRPVTASGFCLHCGRAHDARECYRDAGARRADRASPFA